MQTNTDIQTVAQEDKSSDFIKTSMSLPVGLHRAMRVEGLNRGLDAQEVWAEAGREYLAARSAK